MDTTRLSKLIVGAALIIAALVALQAFRASGSAEKSNRPYVGMGDLHVYEAGTSRHPYAGMGDVRLYEAQQGGRRPYVGMGDLHVYEAQSNRRPYVGMGDLHVFEAWQAKQSAGEINSPAPY